MFDTVVSPRYLTGESLSARLEARKVDFNHIKSRHCRCRISDFLGLFQKIEKVAAKENSHNGHRQSYIVRAHQRLRWCVPGGICYIGKT